MKRLIVGLMIILVFATSCLAGRLPAPDLYNDLPKKANALIVYPDQNIIDKYNWLKSSDRDAKMGALSSTNWRTLILIPGYYNLGSSTWTIDTDYLAIVSINENPRGVLIYGNGAPLVTQTANIIYLGGLTFKNTATEGTRHGFVINCTSHNSYYYRCDFRHAAAYQYVREPIRLASDANGIWWFCNADASAWCLATNKSMRPKMYYCTGLDRFVGGDQDNNSVGTGVVGGEYYYCTGGGASMGGCAGFGTNIEAGTIIEDCNFGGNSVAAGKAFYGTIRRTHCGLNGPCGYVVGSNYPTFAGIAEDVYSDGGNCFGMGHSSGSQGGIITRCRIGDYQRWKGGAILGSRKTTITNINKSLAKYDLDSNNANGDLYFRAISPGAWANNLIIERVKSGLGLQIVAVYLPSTSNYLIQIKKNVDPTAADVVAAINDDSVAKMMVNMGYEGTGAGAIDFNGTFSLAGGSDGVQFNDNCPPVPVDCPFSIAVAPFDNGATYSNASAITATTFSLPYATVGLRYRFNDANHTTTVDPNVKPKGTDRILKATGTLMSLGEGYINTSDAFASILLSCNEPNVWHEDVNIGSGWTEEGDI